MNTIIPSSRQASTTKPVDGAHRFQELDAMRGVAACIVVVHHFVLLWIVQVGTNFGIWSTLGYPLIAGHESVVLFFLLSGFVLSLPYLRHKEQSYPIFLVRRILRIYGPYLFALGFAVAGAAVWHNSLDMGAWANNTWSRPVRSGLVVQHILFIGDYDSGQFNTAFWSLIIEMRVSLIFPVLFWLVNRLRTQSALLLAAGCSLVVQFVANSGRGLRHEVNTLESVTVFICGILMAKNLEGLSKWFLALSVGRRLALFATAFMLYNFSHLAKYCDRYGMWRISSWHVGDWPVVAGAAVYVLVGLKSKIARRILNTAIPRFLGRISYSLYLVHGTVLFGLTHLLHYRVSAAEFFPIYILGSLLVAVGFYRVVEEPLLHLARRVGARPRMPVVPVAG